MTQEELFVKIGRWNELQKQLAAVKDQELKLRTEIFAAAFPAPIEGTNTSELPEGWELKGVYKLIRTLDEAALPAVLKELHKHKINTDALVTYKPSLNIKGYRIMDSAFRPILEQAMEIKPGAPSLELVPPKS